MSESSEPIVSPFILATGGNPDSVAHYVCPEAEDGGSHHLVPRYTQRGDDVTNTTRCRTCKRTESELRKDVGL